MINCQEEERGTEVGDWNAKKKEEKWLSQLKEKNKGYVLQII